MNQKYQGILFIVFMLLMALNQVSAWARVGLEVVEIAPPKKYDPTKTIHGYTPEEVYFDALAFKTTPNDFKMLKGTTTVKDGWVSFYLLIHTSREFQVMWYREDKKGQRVGMDYIGFLTKTKLARTRIVLPGLGSGMAHYISGLSSKPDSIKLTLDSNFPVAAGRTITLHFTTVGEEFAPENWKSFKK